MTELKTFTLTEVSKHNKDGDMWVAIDGFVYDLTKFSKLHPGGQFIIKKFSGQDVSEQFKVYHHESIMKKYHDKLVIGKLDEQPPTRPINPPDSFGDMVPYGDPSWYQRLNSPYYKDTHRDWRERVRKFVDTEILATYDKWQNDDVPPKDILLKMGKMGMIATMVGPPFPKEYVDPDTYIPEDFDYFHELITFDEISRCGHASVIGALTNGPAIALPAIIRFGTEEMKKRVGPEVMSGRKMIALAISEPNTGSDVANLITEAKKVGDHYVVNGAKKWITNGYYADYFVTAVRTGEKGQLSFLLIEKDMPGFSVRKLDIRGSNISGTAYLDFNNVKVPASNLIGEENNGFKLIMYNFNHERMYVAISVSRLARVCLEESIKYALNRKAFGKRLSEIQNIRMKIASMARSVEQLHTWVEYLTYNLCTMDHYEANIKLGDIICLIKAQASKVYEHCARETTMIFGGNALYMNGVGKKIEPAVLMVKGYQIPAGAEDVMDDFAARSAFKMALKMAKL